MNYTDLDLAILKSITANKKLAVDFVTDCDSKLFSTDVWNFAKIIMGYIKTFKDVPTLRVIEEQLSKGSNTKQIEYVKSIWNKLNDFKYDEKEFKFDLEKLKNRYAEQQILQFQELLKNNSSGKIDVSKTLQEMQKVTLNIKSVSNYKNYESRNIKEYLPTFVDKFNAKKKNPEFDRGILTKYSFFDYATNGIRPADMILIAGESGFGKSLFLMNMAIQIWLQDNNVDMESSVFKEGKNIIFFSLEMPFEECFNRLLSRLSGVPSRSIENSQLTKEEFAKVRKCLNFIERYPYQFKIVDIADASANELESILTETAEDFDAIFVDYLGIMKQNEKSEEADWLKQGVIAYEIRAIARKYKLPVFSAVQLNRKALGKDSSENIGLARLARSGTIATHATHVIQIENRPKEENFPNFIYHLIKNRKGPKGKGTLIKNLSCATLLDDGTDNTENNYNNYFTDREDISEEMEFLEL